MGDLLARNQKVIPSPMIVERVADPQDPRRLTASTRVDRCRANTPPRKLRFMIGSTVMLIVFGLAAADTTSRLVPIPFEVGAFGFRAGDSITIDAVLGDRNAFEVGGRYLVKGTYELSSCDAARISAYVTNGEVSGQRSSRKVSRGRGTFELEFTIEREGEPHVSFYPATSGDVMGGIYFGSRRALRTRADWLQDLDADRDRCE
jgi:hypothetical protein